MKRPKDDDVEGWAHVMRVAATHERITLSAHALGIQPRTLRVWLERRPELAVAITQARRDTLDALSRRLRTELPKLSFGQIQAIEKDMVAIRSGWLVQTVELWQSTPYLGHGARATARLAAFESKEQ